MTRDEIIEKALREKNIYPPSVQDSHYGDKAEMTREEIIEKTLMEMSILSPSEKDSQSWGEADLLSGVIAELERRLPYGNIKTCGAFRHLNAGCCDSCHTSHPHYAMELIGLPDGGKAWVCCAVAQAIYPERHAEHKERFRNSPEAKLWRGIFGDADRPKN